MSWDPLTVRESVGDPSVMAAVDDADDGRRLVIADLDADESWLSIPVEAALELAEYR